MSIKLLIVDDDKLIRETYQSVLSVSGYDVGVAGDLPTTERLLKGSIPDYLLLDLIMKPKNGWQILEEIRQNPTWQKIPIIIFSGKVVYAHEIQRYGSQVVGYIRKPTRLPDIIKEFSRVSSCQIDALAAMEKARDSGLSEEEIVELQNLLLTIPVLDLLSLALQQNFRNYAGEGKNLGLIQDPDVESLRTWLEGKKTRCTHLTELIG
ncbi:MAG TPA: response regulator [Methanospirillum sp.]|nr:response regulator [Methanospirillum sp.]